MTQTNRLEMDDAVLGLAATVVDRTRELIADGYVKGALNSGFKGVECFCVHGAMNLALQEVFGENGDSGRVNVCGGYAATTSGYGTVEALATAYIVEEANEQFAYGGKFSQGDMAAAPFNDAEERTQDQVLSVLDGASRRLWALVGREEAEVPEASHWTEQPTQEVPNFLYARLA